MFLTKKCIIYNIFLTFFYEVKNKYLKPVVASARVVVVMNYANLRETNNVN
jgi:hypothetical protein